MDCWNRIVCDKCESILYDPGLFERSGNIFNYFMCYRCRVCQARGVCKICKKQVEISGHTAPMYVHMMTHYGIDEFEVTSSIIPGYEFYSKRLNASIPYMFLLSLDWNIIAHASIEDDETESQLTVFIMKSKCYCVICEDDYDSFPTVDIVDRHLKRNHRLVDSPDVKSINYTNCRHYIGTPRPCNINNNITSCDGVLHINRLDKLPVLSHILRASTKVC